MEPSKDKSTGGCCGGGSCKDVMQTPEPDSHSKVFAGISHLGMAVQLIYPVFLTLGGAFNMAWQLPILNLVLPLILYFVYKDNPYIKHHARNALDFQITTSLLLLPFYLIGVIFDGMWAVKLSSMAYQIIPVASLALGVVAAVKANMGYRFHYFFNLNIMKTFFKF